MFGPIDHIDHVPFTRITISKGKISPIIVFHDDCRLVLHKMFVDFIEGYALSVNGKTLVSGESLPPASLTHPSQRHISESVKYFLWIWSKWLYPIY